MKVPPLRRRAHRRPVVSALAVLALAPPAVAALVGAVPGGPAAARELVPLTFTPSPATLTVAAGILAANAKVAALPLLGALAVSVSAPQPRWAGSVRGLFAALLAVTVALNVTVLGLALGGYGPGRMLPWLAHWPLEAAGLAVALGAFVTARRERHNIRDLRDLLRYAVTGLVLLASGALVETYTGPQR
jgi:hypothetical protein